MADETPNTPGPKPGESAKIQPKKETVRITLPPKPSSAPTVKLPTLPPGGGPAGAAAPAAGPAAAPAGTRPASTPPGAPKPPTPPASAKPGSRVAAPPSAARPAAASAAPAARRPAAARPTTVSALDQGLAIGAMIASVLALGAVIFLMIVQN